MKDHYLIFEGVTGLAAKELDVRVSTLNIAINLLREFCVLEKSTRLC